MTNSSIYLYERQGGTAIYLSGSQQNPYTGSGTPWRALGTTPIRIGMNDVTGPMWTPTAAPPAVIMTGGPPFALGRIVQAVGYDAVEEQIPIQIYADSPDNAMEVLQVLRRALSSGPTFGFPALVVQPANMIGSVGFIVYSGVIQESAEFINREARTGVLRAVMTITRSARSGRMSGVGETLINAATLNMGGLTSGTVANFSNAFGTGTGNAIHEGSPINLRITAASGTATISTLYLATGGTPSTSTTSAGTHTTSSPTFVAVGSASTITNSSLLSRPNRKIRVLGVTTQWDASAEMRIVVLSNSGGDAVLYGPIVRAPVTTNTDDSVVDFGMIPNLERYNSGLIGATFQSVQLHQRSTSGASQTIVLNRLIFIAYDTFCSVVPPSSSASTLTGTQALNLETLATKTDHPRVPMATPRAFRTDAGARNSTNWDIRGQVPVYIEGSTLTAIYRSPNINGVVNLTLTATHFPQYQTLRGLT